MGISQNAAYPLVTLVGGSGFVGRHTVKLFTEKGWRVRVLCRDTVAAEFLKTAGYPGQVVLDYADITRPETLNHKFGGSNAVVNLVSILAESGRQRFTAINVAGAKAVAEQAALVNTTSFVQISALGIDKADAVYAKTKRAGEDAVRAAFPTATILRPSLIIGPEDGFFQRFARMSMLSPALPLINRGRTQFQPLLVEDVAQAIYIAATNTAAAGKTYELAGEHIYSFRQLLEIMLTIIKRPTRLVRLPNVIAKAMAFVSDLLPLKPMITRDQLRMLKVDSIITPGALNLGSLGIRPHSVEAALPELLSRYVKE